MIDSLLTWLNYTDATAFGMQQGALVAIIFGFGLLLIRFVPKYKWFASALLLVLITPLATLGFWFSTGDLGISDWDYYFSLHHGHRQTLLEYKELPHWNPYICGGTAGLADPEFRLFTPTFLTQLAFGIPVGFRLAIWIATAFGAVGVLLLGKRLGLSHLASTTSALAVTFSTVNLLEIVEGHPNIFAAMFIPWIFWAWASTYLWTKNKSFAQTLFSKWSIVTGVFLALTFFQGGIYLLMYTAFAYLALPLLVRRKRDALYVVVSTGLWGLGFVAIKLVPVVLWLTQFQDNMYASSTYTLSHLNDILLGRHLHGLENVIPHQGSGWHEYGAYIGPIVLLLALIAFIYSRKKRVVWMLTITALLAILVSSTGPLLKPLFDQAPFLPRSNISRVILFAVIPISLLAGFGLDQIAMWINNRSKITKKIFALVPVFIVTFIAVDLISLSYPLSEQAFVLPKPPLSIPQANEPLQHSPYTYTTRHNGVDYSRAYSDILRGYGSMNYCSVLTPPPSVRIITDEGTSGPVLVESESKMRDKGTYQIHSWSPNSVSLQVQAPEMAKVVLNTNFAKGWTANGNPAQDISNRVGWRPPNAGKHNVDFKYKTPGFTTGAWITGLTAFAAIILLTRNLRKRSIGH